MPEAFDEHARPPALAHQSSTLPPPSRASPEPESKREERSKRKAQPEPDEETKGPESGTRFSQTEIHDHIAEAAEEELERPTGELTWSSIEAGLAIGFSFLAGAYLTTLAPEHLHRAVNAVGYPLGFIFVVLARSQLFTENTLEPVIPFLEKRDGETFKRMLRLWAIVLAGNLVGALVFGLVMARTPLLDEPFRAALLKVAEEATREGFWLTAYKAVFAGWLIALMAWLIASTRSTGAQIALIWLTTAPIAAFGFKHSIAGSTEAFYRAASGDASWGAMAGNFIVPAVLGNIVGGVVLVALLNHVQVEK